MKISRLAVPALVALSLAACSSSDSGTNSNNSTARIQAYQKFSAAATRAGNAGASGAAEGFIFAGIAQLFGSSTATVNVTSNGQASLSIAGRPTQQLGRVPAFATAGSYTAVGVSLRDISHYTGQTVTDTSDINLLIAYKDTTALILGGSSLSADTFDGQGNGQGSIYESPNLEWIATAGSFNLGSMSLGGDCTIDTTIRQALISAYGGNASNVTFACSNATFNGALNITASQGETTAATGSRTATITANGLPGIRVVTNGTYSGTALRAGFARHAR